MLLLFWVAQNVVLLTSALLRLDLYVEAYGLTYLRIRAGIGMFLVLTGMVLLIWQLYQEKSNFWLSSVFAAVVVAVFYFGSFVNFGYVITKVNLARDEAKLDSVYLCELVPGGEKAWLEHAERAGEKPCRYMAENWWMERARAELENWRAWTYRSSRILTHKEAYLSKVSATDLDGSDSQSPSGYIEQRGALSDAILDPRRR